MAKTFYYKVNNIDKWHLFRPAFSTVEQGDLVIALRIRTSFMRKHPECKKFTITVYDSKKNYISKWNVHHNKKKNTHPISMG